MADVTRKLGRARGTGDAGGGFVSLVGAGPGDPSLLTLKALKRLREADVVYHDALVSGAILALRREGARLVSVGKRRGDSSVAQEEIEAALVRDARAGLTVVRLKGGDPFVFGRGGEEALALAESGIPFEIVPGISSGIAVPALSGIPLTHRGLSSSAAFVTAHDLSPGPAGVAARRRLQHLARGAETLVIFMAGAEAARVGRALLDAGLPPGTPVALIENGTLDGERFTRTTIEGLSRLGGSRMEGPVLIVVGKTVAISDALQDRMNGGGAGAGKQTILRGAHSPAREVARAAGVMPPAREERRSERRAG